MMHDMVVQTLEMLKTEDLPKYRRDDLGAQWILWSVPAVLGSIQKDLLAASVMDDEEIPAETLDELTRELSLLQDTLRHILDWKPADDDVSTRNLFINKTSLHRDYFANNLRPVLRPSPDGVTEILQQAAELLPLKQQLEDAVSTFRSASVKEANFEVAQYFENAAAHHHSSAQRHLIAASVFGVLLTVGVILLFFTFPPGTTSVAELVQHTIGRATVLLVGTAAIAFCTRNYRVNKHLEVMNRTRYNILLTAGLYVAGVTDEARNLVVAELVRSIFSPGDTGYMNTDREQTIIENPGSLVGLVTPKS